MICNFEHIPEIPKELWKCTRCGTKYPDFYVHHVYDQAPDLCEKLHPQDEIICLGCDAMMTAKQWVEEMEAKKQIEVCPTCGGKGLIDSDNPIDS